MLNVELFSANACDCELVNCELIVFEHELSLIIHKFYHELNLWVIYGQFMDIRVYIKLEH